MSNPPPEDPAARVILDFQVVMGQFLDLQRRVFSALLSVPHADTTPTYEYVASVEPSTTVEYLAAPIVEMPAIAAPPAVAGTAPRDPQRLALRAVVRPLSGVRGSIAPGHAILISDDGRGVAIRLAERFRTEGHRVAIIDTAGEGQNGPHHFTSTLESPEEAQRVVAAVTEANGPIGAYLHLLPIKPVAPFAELDAAEWWRRVSFDTRSLFLLSKALRPSLQKAASQGGAAVIAVTGMGGAFGSDADYFPPSFFPGNGGVVGFAKCLAVESPGVRVRAVDLALDEPPDALASHVLDELWAEEHDVEVGYARGRRLALELEVAPPVFDPGYAVPSDAVILATGGARGITADVCLELAERYQPTFVIIGQMRVQDEPEPEDTASMSGTAELKRALTERLRRQGTPVTIAAVERAYQQLQKEREVRQNIGALTAAGARVVYVSLDVRDEDAFAALIDDIYATYGRLDGVIHGAGIIEDKLIQDKSVESFDRVLGTKIRSAFALSRKLRPETLRFVVFFTSVAGRFGNRGQSDYAAANETVSKLALWLDRQWPARVCSIAWAPWDKRGMVSEELKLQFAQRGVDLLRPEAGRLALWAEIQQPSSDRSEIVIAGSAQAAPGGTSQVAAEPAPLLKHAQRIGASGGTVQYERVLDPAHDAYLIDHRLDGRPVLPMAFATELMAEAAQATWPDLTIVAIRNLRLMKGIALDGTPIRITIDVHASSYSREARFTQADIEIQTPGIEPTSRYRCSIEMAERMQEPPVFGAPVRELMPLPMNLDAIYRRWTFHGPLFQRVTKLDGMDDDSIVGRIYSSSRTSGVSGVRQAAWHVDPYVFDSALQMVLIWSRAQNGKTALPTRFRAFHRYGDLSDVPLTCYVRVENQAGGHALTCDFQFVDPQGRLVAVLEGQEASCSEALNRLTANADESA